MARLVKNETVELFGDNVTVPFINGCDNSYHPCQILADALTIIEKFGSLNVKFLYIGAKNNVFNSLVEFFSKMKQGTLYGLTPLVNDTACGPDFYEEAKKTGYYVELDPNMPMDEVKKYVKDMDICYTDTWLDMEFFNDPAYQDKKKELMDKMMPYQLNDEFLEGSHALVFHDRKSCHVYIDKRNLSGIIYGCVAFGTGVCAFPWLWYGRACLRLCREKTVWDRHKEPAASQIKYL